ncbi:hypothetical protein QCC34_07485 [Pseudomonas aeruginosa]|uniref:hypothetical protein n=1 Tax=Pseudomonas aeruginosa TaxID=287 RepID=UPI0026E04500|nr:hypothetical protein [Pseudomonas aeruginosa]MDO5935740.1 hypothetical protein [Pseudomonas aeruginosa]MDO5949467.1 hypothetical protein [Pseudomonas aeruginosa]MDY1522435.1 hypothetical protein [Pseudomonas aeruginosa]HCF1305146.1 hypothetical protein [Pseudomonas aeruginosa]HCP6202347.1 hypothetical protein [Pseudomonas aeruginosa]
MSSTQHQLIEQCVTRLRGIVEALDNIHDTSPQRWSTDLDDVHSSAESLLAMIKDHAPPSEDQLIATGLSYPLAKGLAGTPLRDAPASVEQAGRDVEPAPCPFCGGEVDPTGWLRGDGTRGPECNYCGATARSMEAWQTRAALSHAPTSSASPSCKWTESSGIWETGCGQTWSFIEDGPAENGALFCHHCGGRLVLIKSDDQEDDGEPCPECMEHGCNGECAGHGAMGD